MAGIWKPGPKLAPLLELFSNQDRWLILTNADPDALASAMALRRIMARRVREAAIVHVNEITRPDNLAMIQYLRIPTKRFKSFMIGKYDRFALVDSQPHHHPAFRRLRFTAVIDHHPLVEEEPVLAEFQDIRPEYGATSTIFTEYLASLRIRPGQFLSTALLYGIKSDTLSFERVFSDADIRAFRHLSRFSNPNLLRRIVKSEFRLEWLEYFSRAFANMQRVGRGLYVWLDEVENPDILVILADFFMRVHEVAWTAVAGIYENRLVVIFRGDGVSKNVGELAGTLFGELGSAGGHKTMARAEVPLSKLEGASPDAFVEGKLAAHRGRRVRERIDHGLEK